MGWATGDTPKVTQAKVQLSKLKEVSYRALTDLTTTLSSIEHSEKGPRLRNLVYVIKQKMEEIEVELNR